MTRNQDEHGGIIVQVTENKEENMNNQQDVGHLEMPCTNPGRDSRPQYPKKLTLILSFIQLGIASLAIITQVVIQASRDRYYRGHRLDIWAQVSGVEFC